MRSLAGRDFADRIIRILGVSDSTRKKVGNGCHSSRGAGISR